MNFRCSRKAILSSLIVCAATHAEPEVELNWATYFGGDGEERFGNVIVDGSNNALIAGETYSSGIAHNCSDNSGRSGNSDAFWGLFDSDGSRLRVCHITGLGYGEIITSVAHHGDGYYLTGFTESDGGIATEGAHQTEYNTGRDGKYVGHEQKDAFFARVDGEGRVIWGTYFGGRENDHGFDAKVGPDGNVYFAGQTSSFTNVATPGTHQDEMDPDNERVEARVYVTDGFLTKFDPDGAQLWGTYIGGKGYDRIEMIAVDGEGNIYAAGGTSSESDIATPGAHQTEHGPIENYWTADDAFLAKFNSQGGLEWATYLGGELAESGRAVALDDQNNVYMVGKTESETNIAQNGRQDDLAGKADGFIAKFTSTGELLWSSYFGGAESDAVTDIQVDGEKIYLTGTTRSTDGIAQNGSDMDHSGDLDCFVAVMNLAGELIWSTYFGGAEVESDCKLALGDQEAIFIGGRTRSPSGIAVNGFQTEFNEGNSVGYDVFLAKMTDLSGDTQSEKMTSRPLSGQTGKTDIRITKSTMVLSNISGPCRITVHDASGRIVLARKMESNYTQVERLSVPQAWSGVYFVNIQRTGTLSGSRQTVKVVAR